MNIEQIHYRRIPWALLALLLALTVLVVESVGLRTTSGSTSAERQKSPPTMTATTSTTTTSTLVPDPCFGVFGPEPHNLASTAAMEPLLIVAADLPEGYATSGPTTTGLPEFLAAVPQSIPEVVVDFEHLDIPGNGSETSGNEAGPTEGVSEVLGLTSSPAQATELLRHVLSVQEQCGDDETAVALPGPIAGLNVDEGIGGNRAQFINSGQLFAAKGPYLVSILWFNQAPTGIGPSAPTGAPPIPSPAEMAVVADAALNRLP